MDEARLVDLHRLTLTAAARSTGTAGARSVRPPASRDWSQIVDLNRIPLPADTPIIDERFAQAPPTKPAWQELADVPGKKIDGIRAYREEHGAGLAEAKNVVEDYIQSKRGTPPAHRPLIRPTGTFSPAGRRG